MNLLKQQYIDCYNNVARWNFIAGNDSHDSEAMQNQISYVLSEIAELVENKKTVFADKQTQLIAFIDDLADIFVTSAFFNFQMNSFKSCSIYQYDIQKQSALTINPSFIDEHSALRLMCSDWVEFDMIHAINRVMNSNFSKFIPVQYVGAIEESTVRLQQEHGEIYTVENEGYVVFKRKSDNKILKPSIYHKPVGLGSTIYEGAI